IVAKRDRYERGVRELIADGVRRGALGAADAGIATRAFLGALNWTAQWFRPDGPDTPQRVADVVAAFAVAGLAPDSHHADDAPQRLHPPDRQRRADRGRVRPVQDAARGPA